ncbi:MAG TPA: head GIN domain-containing protein [Pyrinomonadaceae bacterium]|nr:head GIN domain-containing protein [Pyrinomonadaceae bacterium]
MKRITIFVLLSVLTIGCHHGMMSQVSGSGNRQKQKRDVASFTSISTEGAFHIEVVAQQQPSLEIEADDNILPLIGTDVSNNVLQIKPKKGYSASQPVIIKIGVANLEGFSADGAGKVDVTGLNNEKFELEVNGAPSVNVSGETKLVRINTSGAATIDTSKLRATRAVVESKGVSQVEVRAAEHLDVTVSGPSNVVYSGDPVVNQTINGPGSVQKKRSSSPS